MTAKATKKSSTATEIVVGDFHRILEPDSRWELGGFALTLGVILDTFIVRPILVPAFLAWLYRLMPERKPVHHEAVEGRLEPALAASMAGEAITIPAKPHTEMAVRRSVKG